MEFVTLQVTPTVRDDWRACLYIKATMPAINGHPRTLRTFPDRILTGARGLEVGSLAAVLNLSLASLGTLPLCAHCQDSLGEDWAVQ